MGLSPEDLRALEALGRGKHYRNSRRAREQRAELIDLLGGECRKCGADGGDPENPLHVDHLDGRDWEPRAVSSHRRVARYWREYLAGVRLGVLCKECDGYYGPKRQAEKHRNRP